MTRTTMALTTTTTTTMGVMMVMVMVMMGSGVRGHIRLTYPPARRYQFDFLDNARTPGPCGMPSGLGGATTMLEAGSTLDVHWHLSYPHKGGYFFEVRDRTEAVTARYPESGYTGSDDGTSLQYSVPLPQEPCENCTFRMVRQAAEWGERYLFWSCADINIMPGVASRELCSGHGQWTNGACQCDRLYRGDRCQFKEECEGDGDCGGSSQGKCVNTAATSYPVHQCYCKPPWFGSRCEKRSSVTSLPSDLAAYSSRVLSSESDVTVYYRIVQDEVEVMLRAKTASWLGFGWRPSSLDKTCQNFPDLGDDMYKMGDSEPEGEGKAEGEGDPESEGTTAEPEGTTAEPEGTTAEPEGTTAEPEGTTGEPEGTTAEPEGTTAEPTTTGNDTTSEGEATAESENGTAESTPESDGYNSTAEAEAEGTTEPEGEPHPEGEGGAEEEGEAEGEGESHSDLHAMDCTDLVIGSARGGYSRIGDYYTRDRSTPVHDEYLGGINSLTAGLVAEQGDYTVLLFRKKLQAAKKDKTDHSLANEVTHVLWAMGQSRDSTTGRYNHAPSSALETEGVSIPDFYREDELKYHGHQGQRGAAAFNFYPTKSQGEDCNRGECSAKNCGLEFSWTYDVNTDVITFNISAKYVNEDQWIALGFSDDEAMSNSDVIFGGIDTDGTPFVKDGWLYDKKAPRVDRRQDAQLVSGQHVNKRTTLVFTRKRVTGDPEDLDLSQCRHLFFANKGGNIKGGSQGTFTKHFSKPVISPGKMCFGLCRQDVTYATLVTVRFPDGEYVAAYSDPYSAQFKETAAKIELQLKERLQQQLGDSLRNVIVLALRAGSLVVDFEVQTKVKAAVTEDTVKQEVTSAVEKLKDQPIEGYGALEVTNVAAPLILDDGVDKRPPGDGGLTTAEIIIIAVVLALFLAVVIIGVCKFMEIRRARLQRKAHAMEETDDGAAGGGQRDSKGRMTTYGEFMTASSGGRHSGSDHTGSLKNSQPTVYPAFGNPGYDSAGYKLAP